MAVDTQTCSLSRLRLRRGPYYKSVPMYRGQHDIIILMAFGWAVIHYLIAVSQYTRLTKYLVSSSISVNLGIITKEIESNNEVFLESLFHSSRLGGDKLCMYERQSLSYGTKVVQKMLTLMMILSIK